MKKNILILFQAIGHGHKKIAENIGAALERDFAVDYINILEFEKGQMSEGGTWLYFFILKYCPWFWEFMYVNKIFLALTMPWRTVVARFKTKKLEQLLNEKHYDAVISVHTNSSALMSVIKSKNKFQGKFIIGFSDPHLNKFWLYKNADYFLANIPEQVEEMVEFGIPREKILVTGITIPQPQKFDMQQLKNKFGLSAEEKMILTSGGGFGWGFDRELLEQLLRVAEKNNAKVFVVCGTNKKLFDELNSFYVKQDRIKIFGYVQNMAELYGLADVIISKPGGLTTTECLSYFLPIVISTPLPGQERINTEYLLKHKLVVARQPGNAGIIQAVDHELQTGEFRASLKTNPDVELLVQHGDMIREALTKLL